ncbi:MAG: hypothetical protein OEW02_06460 [Myxococcales bacterium]|nr:hypothetical protein [Myxococcales bacterium]
MALAIAAGCFGARQPMPAPEGGSVAVASDVALSFQKRVDGFYLRLAHRRFNTLETYSDFILRDHFKAPDLFFDYYADLAQALTDAHIDKSRPFLVRVEAFLFEDAEVARVLVRFEGWDGRPLRPGREVLSRIDRWEWADGTWWIRPGKL